MRSLGTCAAAAVLSLASCATPPTTTYDWGAYQDSLYRMWVRRGDFDPAGEANRLANQIEQTLLAGRLVPPGVQAHLAMLCAAAGDPAGAVAHLEAEKFAFPESSVFVDGMLARMKK